MYSGFCQVVNCCFNYLFINILYHLLWLFSPPLINVFLSFYSHLPIYHFRRFSTDSLCPMILKSKVCRNGFVESQRRMSVRWNEYVPLSKISVQSSKWRHLSNIYRLCYSVCNVDLEIIFPTCFPGEDEWIRPRKACSTKSESDKVESAESDKVVLKKHGEGQTRVEKNKST